MLVEVTAGLNFIPVELNHVDMLAKGSLGLQELACKPVLARSDRPHLQV